MTSLSEILERHIQRAHSSVNRLARLSGVPKQTITNWLGGRVRKPRRWQEVIKVAKALHLSDVDTDELLKAAGQRSLWALRRTDLEGDDDLLAAWAETPAGPSTPFQVIPDLPSFIGRRDELAAVSQALLADGRASLCGISGMGGVGKTVLAAHLAYELRAHFRDGVLWARLDTSDAFSILGVFLDALGQSPSAHTDFESRRTAVRAVLADKRALIILDNAETSEQVQALLPPTDSDCAVLITTRNALSVTDGWASVWMGPFEDVEDSFRLFEQILGTAWANRHRSVLGELADALGHLPLALSILAGQLGAGQVNPSDALASLRAPTHLDQLEHDDRSVRRSFDLSFATLSPEQQRLFATLGLFSGDDFGGESVAYLNDLDPPGAERQLRELVHRSLVQDSQAGRWSLHPLLRTYAREILEERGALPVHVTRMLRMYQEATAGTWRFARPLDAEILNARFALDQAIQLHLEAPFLETVHTLHPIWLDNGWLALGLPYLVQARTLARASGDTATEIRMMTWASAFHLNAGRLDDSQSLLQSAQTMAEAAGLTRELADVLCAIGKLHYDQGRQALAKPYYAQSLALARQTDYAYTMGRSLHNLALMEFGRGQHLAAEAMYVEALELFRGLGYELGVNTTLVNLANALHALGRSEQAWALRQEALASARQNNHRVLIVTTLLGMVENCLERLQLDQADMLLGEALERAVELETLRLESIGRVFAADLLRRRERFIEADEQVQKGLTIALRLKDIETQVRALVQQGQLFIDLRRMDEALTILEAALSLAHELGLPGYRAEVQFHLARAEWALARPDRARRLAAESLRTHDAVGTPSQARTVRDWLRDLDSSD